MLQPVTQVFHDVHWPARCLVLFLVAAGVLAMILPPYYGWRYEGNFWSAMFTTNDAMTCITLDALIAVATFLVWALWDIHQLRMSLLTFVALCGGVVIAVAVPIPLYLAARTVRVAKMEATQPGMLEPKRSVFCPLLVLLLVGVVSQVVYILTS